jgi:hypothetical protein
LKLEEMDVSDVQKQIFQSFIEKLIARNKFSQNEAENFQKLLENVRDSKNFHKIMEKLKESGHLDLDLEENFREGMCGRMWLGKWKSREEKYLKLLFAENGIFLKDTAKKFGPGGQTLTPRHTIDAILGLNNSNCENGGE